MINFLNKIYNFKKLNNIKFFIEGICWNVFLIIYNLPKLIRQFCFLIEKGREIELRDAIPFIVGIKSLVFQFVNIFTMVSNLNLDITPQYAPITADAFKTISLMVLSSLGPMISNDALLNITLPSFNLASNINERSLLSLEMQNFNIAQNIYQQFAFHYQANAVISNTYIQEGVSLVNQSHVLAERYQLNLIDTLTQLSDSVLTVSDLQVRAGQVAQNGVTHADTISMAVRGDHFVGGSLDVNKGGVISTSKTTVWGDVQVNNVQMTSNELLISPTGTVLASNGAMQLQDLVNAGHLELINEQVNVAHTYTGAMSSSALFTEQTQLHADEAIIGGRQMLNNSSLVTENSIVLDARALLESRNAALLLSKEINVDSNALLSNATLNIVAENKLILGANSNIYSLNSTLNIQAKEVEQMQHGRINMNNVTLIADKFNQKGEMIVDLSNLFVQQHEMSAHAIYSSSKGVLDSKKTTIDSGSQIILKEGQMHSGEIKVGDAGVLEVNASNITSDTITNMGGTIQGKDGTRILLTDSYEQSGGQVNLADSSSILMQRMNISNGAQVDLNDSELNASHSIALTDGTNMSIQGHSALQGAQVTLNVNSSNGSTTIQSMSTLNVIAENVNLGGSIVGGGGSSVNIGAQNATIGNMNAGNLNLQVANDLTQSADTLIAANNVQMLVKHFEQMGQMKANNADVTIKGTHIIDKQGGLIVENGSYKTNQTQVKGEMSVKDVGLSVGDILVGSSGKLDVQNSTLDVSNLKNLNVMNAVDSQVNVHGSYTSEEKSQSTLSNAVLKANNVFIAGEQMMSNAKIEATQTLEFKPSSTLNVNLNTAAQLVGNNIAMHAVHANLDNNSSLSLNATKDLQMSTNVSGNNATVMMKAATGNIENAHMDLSNLKVDVEKLSDDSLQNVLYGNGSINVTDTKMLITNANITLDKELAPSKNVDITSDSISITHGQTRGSEGTLKLEARTGNVQVNAELSGKDIYLVSDQANVNTNEDIRAQNIYVKAQDSFVNARDAHLMASQSLNARAETGHIENRGVLYGGNNVQLYAKAGIENLVNIGDKNDGLKHYTPAQILAGHGGVTAVTDGKFYNEASNIKAVGDVKISAKVFLSKFLKDS